MNKNIFVIGDIHGKYYELTKLISEIDQSTTSIYLVGDLIDRGEESKKVIELLRNNSEIKSVLGNHEVMFIETKSIFNSLLAVKSSTLDFEEKMLEKDMLLLALQSTDWWRCGGSKTYKEYNEDFEAILNDISFLETLPTYIKTNIFNNSKQEALITHTCVLPFLNKEKEVDPLKEDSYMALWPRYKCEEITDNNTQYFNIFGHTPTENFCFSEETEETTPIINKEVGFANVDTGACYDRKKRGRLTGVFFPELTTLSVKSIFPI